MITLEQARDLLARAVDTQGRDFVYNPRHDGKCAYVPQPTEGGPKALTGCLVGVALELAGEARQKSEANQMKSISRLFMEYPDMMTGDAADYFAEAQFQQDWGASWGEAYDAAERWWEYEQEVRARVGA